MLLSNRPIPNYRRRVHMMRSCESECCTKTHLQNSHSHLENTLSESLCSSFCNRQTTIRLHKFYTHQLDIGSYVCVPAKDKRSNARINRAAKIVSSLQFSRMKAALIPLRLNELLDRPSIVSFNSAFGF